MNIVFFVEELIYLLFNCDFVIKENWLEIFFVYNFFSILSKCRFCFYFIKLFVVECSFIFYFFINIIIRFCFINLVLYGIMWIVIIIINKYSN